MVGDGLQGRSSGGERGVDSAFLELSAVRAAHIIIILAPTYIRIFT